jgi:hypothetical protein
MDEVFCIIKIRCRIMYLFQLMDQCNASCDCRFDNGDVGDCCGQQRGPGGLRALQSSGGEEGQGGPHVYGEDSFHIDLLLLGFPCWFCQWILYN